MCGRGDSFVFEQAGRIVGTFVLREGADPAYAKLYSGRWLSQAVAYATIHRIAGTGEVRGLLSHAVAYARKRHQHLRIDTHRDNAVMQKSHQQGRLCLLRHHTLPRRQRPPGL